MKTIKEMIEVMQAYERGEQIEESIDQKVWFTCEPIWNWAKCDYRVKKKVYVPFDTPEEFLAAQKEHGAIIKMIDDDRLLSAFVRADGSVLFILPKSICEKLLINVNDLCGKYEFTDGTPCGKEVISCQH